MANLETGSSPELIGKLARNNLEVIRREYGDGAEGSKLEYHNELHTRDVMCNTKTLIDVWNKEFLDEPITAREEMLLEIAASGHDRVQNAKERLANAKPGDNERLSAEEVASEMRTAGGFSEKDIAFVRACILATIPEFAADKISQPMTETKKMHENGEISEYQLELAKLIADADFGSFGKGEKEFTEWSFRLFKELKKKPEETQDYIRFEIAILKNHQWVSKVGAKAFPHKQESIEAFTKMLEKSDR